MLIGKVKLESNAVLAPLAGISDIGFRYLARKYGAGLTYTEMISAKGLLYKNKMTEQLTTIADNETPSAVQLFGSCPEDMYKAVNLPLIAKFDIIDINMGCPVNKVVKNGEGSALMKTPSLAAELVKAAVEGANGRPITVKIRSGWDSVTAPYFAKVLEKAGASAITVHGRLREQFYTGSANWDVIKEVKESISIPVIGNGDIKTVDDGKRMFDLTGCDGIMLARGAMGKPWIFAEIRGEKPLISLYTDISEHIEKLKMLYPDNVTVNLMKAHLCCYTTGKRGARIIRERLAYIKTVEDVLEIAKMLDTQEECI